MKPRCPLFMGLRQTNASKAGVNIQGESHHGSPVSVGRSWLPLLNSTRYASRITLDCRRSVSARIYPRGLPSGTPFPPRRHSHRRQRQHWRHQCVALRRKGPGRRDLCSGRSQRCGRSAARGLGRIAPAPLRSPAQCGSARSPLRCFRTHVPHLASLPRRQGRGHGIRRLPCSRAPCRSGSHHRLRPARCDHPLRLTGFDHRSSQLPGLRVFHGLRTPSCILHSRPGHRRPAHHSQASSQHSTPADRPGTPLRSRQDRMTVLPIAPRIAVLGSGAWGTALALSLARTGRNVTLWAHSPEAAREILDARENVQFLPGFPLPPNITVTGDNSAVAHADIVVSVVPSEFLRSTLARLSPHIHAGQILLSATKGVENGTFLRMTQVIADSLAQSEPTDAIQPHGAAEAGAIRHDAAGSGAKPALSTEALAPDESRPKLSVAIGALSGPSFAQEVAEGQPTAVTVAFDDPSIAALVQREFSSETLRIYTSTDVIGIELGGALKNVIAIAAGNAAGMGLGHNSTAALITRVVVYVHHH